MFVENKDEDAWRKQEPRARQIMLRLKEKDEEKEEALKKKVIAVMQKNGYRYEKTQMTSFRVNNTRGNRDGYI